MTVTEIIKSLQTPFHPSVVTWKVGGIEPGKIVVKAYAVPYVRLAEYVSRLNDIYGMDWSMSFVPWGSEIICHLTLAGVTRSATSETPRRAEDVSAEELAFKNACAMFGLGAYLQRWTPTEAEFNILTGDWTEESKIKLQEIVEDHFNDYLDTVR